MDADLGFSHPTVLLGLDSLIPNLLAPETVVEQEWEAFVAACSWLWSDLEAGNCDRAKSERETF